MTHHVVNMHFERELAGKISPPLETSFSSPMTRFFLPLANIWASKGDTIFPALPIKGQHVESWGPSQIVSEYAKRHGLVYTIPKWDLILKLQSKAYAHEISPMPGSRIIYNEKDLATWLRTVKPPYVFKSFYGFSGLSHFFKPTNLPFPVLAEPWVERELDFSTQWHVKDGEINYLGSTVLKTSPTGKYEGNIVGVEKALFKQYYSHLLQHKEIVSNVLNMHPEFFGFIGFDSFVYANQLQPICEINARKTMGFVALKLWEQNKGERLILNFGKNVTGTPLIPTPPSNLGKQILLSHQLKYTIE